MIKRILLLLTTVTCLVSCTITEDVVVGEEGAINYVQRIEIPQMAALMNAASMDDKIEMNQISNTEYTYLEFFELLKERGSQKSAKKLGDFSKFEEEMKAVDFVKMRLDMRDNFAIEIINRTKSVDEFNSKSDLIEQTFADVKTKIELQKEAEKLAELNSGKKKKKKKKNSEEEESSATNPLSNISSMKLAFDGKSFSKTIDPTRFLNDYNTDDLVTEEEKNIYAGMLKQIKFKYKYTFPKKIKSVSVKEAMFTQDGKSFIKEYTLEDLINDPTVANFEVELED